MTAVVRDARPPGLAVRVLNPVLTVLLRTPLGRVIAPLALIEFTGRRSARRYRVVVAWHQLDDGPVVLSPAPWRANFAGGARATVRWRGRRHEHVGTLDTDPDSVAAVINTMLSAGTSARGLALRVPTGHRVTGDDVVATRRALVRFRSAGQVGEA